MEIQWQKECWFRCAIKICNLPRLISVAHSKLSPVVRKSSFCSDLSTQSYVQSLVFPNVDPTAIDTHATNVSVDGTAVVGFVQVPNAAIIRVYVWTDSGGKSIAGASSKTTDR